MDLNQLYIVWLLVVIWVDIYILLCRLPITTEHNNEKRLPTLLVNM